jgi:hypothetical protein
MNQLKDSEMLTPYHASDRRVYNGAPCSDMERERKRTAYLDKRQASFTIADKRR